MSQWVIVNKLNCRYVVGKGSQYVVGMGSVNQFNLFTIPSQWNWRNVFIQTICAVEWHKWRGACQLPWQIMRNGSETCIRCAEAGLFGHLLLLTSSHVFEFGVWAVFLKFHSIPIMAMTWWNLSARNWPKLQSWPKCVGQIAFFGEFQQYSLPPPSPTVQCWMTVPKMFSTLQHWTGGKGEGGRGKVGIVDWNTFFTQTNGRSCMQCIFQACPT